MRTLSRLQPYKALRDASDHEPDQDESRGLLCMFCGADGFEDQDELEAKMDRDPSAKSDTKSDEVHIESHPFTKKRKP